MSFGDTLINDATMITLATQTKTKYDELASITDRIANLNAQITNLTANADASTATNVTLRSTLVARLNTLNGEAASDTAINSDDQCRGLTIQIRNNEASIVSQMAMIARLNSDLTASTTEQTTCAAAATALDAATIARIGVVRGA